MCLGCGSVEIVNPSDYTLLSIRPKVTLYTVLTGL